MAAAMPQSGITHSSRRPGKATSSTRVKAAKLAALTPVAM